MTYRELVYMCLDEIKLASDDSYITEDHILFLISKYRAFLLRQKYEKTNMPVSESNYQTVQLYDGDRCPSLLGIAKPRISVQGVKTAENGDEIPYSFYCTYVTQHRFEFIGNNRILAPITYCTIDKWGTLVFKIKPEGTFDIQCEAVFEDILKATQAQMDWSGNVEILDEECPIEAELISGVQELVVKDALGIAYRPKDNMNNANDDLSSLGVASGNPKNNK